ncbi:hypothetical protein V202x_23720 [Gimesia aquarii]|uniref:Uncharacterized protein n=1 Tax=Gimesia aquarii TaxID=2527964 RepID=A0A517WUU8_9PLAN|nr:hypothetical protein V202x_23720 [Gimesia aquarii]
MYGAHPVGGQGETGVDHFLAFGVEVEHINAPATVSRTQYRRSVDREVTILGERIDEDNIIELTAHDVFHEAGVRVGLLWLNLSEFDGVATEDILWSVDDIDIEENALAGEAEVDRVVTVDIGDHILATASPRFHQEDIVAPVFTADAVAAAVQVVAAEAVTEDVIVVVAGNVVVAITAKHVFDTVVVITATSACD